MTARRTGPRATKGSKTASRTPRARTKTDRAKKATARKESGTSRSQARGSGRSGARKTGAKNAVSKKSTSKKTVRKKAASGKSAPKKTAKKQAARKRAAAKPSASQPARKAAPTRTTARARPTSPRGFRIAATRAREVGTIGRAFTQARAAVLELSGELRVGDWIAVRGATTDFTQQVESLRLDGQPVEGAGAGDTVGIATSERTRVGDRVERLDP